MNDFSIVEESLIDILKTEDKSELRHILEFDLSIPKDFQDFFADYPLVPSRVVIVMDKLSNEEMQM